jgi:hypothetical protein
MQDQLANIYSILSGADTRAMQQVGMVAFLFLMAVSLISSLFIAYLYVHFYAGRATGSQVHRAFPLLGISVTAIFVTIQFSLPLSLGLLGALSIVRFRTPIKEPEEIGFIMLVIASAIACATFKIAFLGVTIAVALAALVAQRVAGFIGGGVSDGVLVITLPERDYQGGAEAISQLIAKRLSKARLESISKNDGQMVLSYNFRDITQPALLALQSDLNAASSQSSFNIFFNRTTTP